MRRRRRIRPIEAAQEESFEQLVGVQGDGDKLALEDAIQLARSIGPRPGDLPGALHHYEAVRSAEVLPLQNAARNPAEWIARAQHYAHLPPPPAALVCSLDRAMWVPRLHYVNVVHPRRAVLTGMTKDGTFLVEGGRVVRPIRNLRFTEAIPEAFSRIAAIGSETRLVGAEYSGINARVPALLVDGFTFTGATAAETAE